MKLTKEDVLIIIVFLSLMIGMGQNDPFIRHSSYYLFLVFIVACGVMVGFRKYKKKLSSKTKKELK